MRATYDEYFLNGNWLDRPLLPHKPLTKGPFFPRTVFTGPFFRTVFTRTVFTWTVLTRTVLTGTHDIRREIKNLFVRTDMLISRFNKCSTNVKLTLLKSFCMSCMMWHCTWKYFSVTVFNKFRSCYNKCMKKLFGFQRLKVDSMSDSGIA